MRTDQTDLRRKLARLAPRWLKQLIKYAIFVSEYFGFKKLTSGHENRFPPLCWRERLPCLDDKNSNTPYDKHYIYHPAWAARVLARTKPSRHVDISSSLSFSTIVSAFIPVDFYDYRPALLRLSGMNSKFGDLMRLPFEDGALESVSCMHVIEHVGLGRYGDPQDVDGDIKSLAELKRIVRSGGDLLIVVPVGFPRIAFNAHRIYSYEQIVGHFAGFELQEFSLITDSGSPEDIIENASPTLVGQQKYGCGCFWFRKL